MFFIHRFEHMGAERGTGMAKRDACHTNGQSRCILLCAVVSPKPFPYLGLRALCFGANQALRGHRRYVRVGQLQRRGEQ